MAENHSPSTSAVAPDTPNAVNTENPTSKEQMSLNHPDFVAAIQKVVSEMLAQSISRTRSVDPAETTTARDCVQRAHMLEQAGNALNFHPVHVHQDLSRATPTTRDRGQANRNQGMSLPSFNAPSFIPITDGNPGSDQIISPSYDSTVGAKDDNGRSLNPVIRNGVPNSGLHSPFSLGPGHTPIPAKLVSKILTGQYVEFSDLNPENLDMPEQPQQCVTIAGQYVIPSPSAHPQKKGVDNIVTWVECFVSYMSVITAHMPHRSRDLLAHLSLILRTSKRFGGNA